jgi:hypothetical protein
MTAMAVTRDLARDPVVAAALRAHGLESDPPWIFRDCDDRLSVAAVGAAPRVTIGDACAIVRWRPPGRSPMFYQATLPAGGRPMLTIDDVDMAESMLAMLTGRPLSDLVRIDGDPGYVMTDVGTQRLGEYRKLYARLGYAQAIEEEAS